MARNIRPTSPKKVASLKLPQVDSLRVSKELDTIRQVEEHLERLGFGQLYSFVEAKEQERTMKALLTDSIEQERANLLRRAKAFVAEDLRITIAPQSARKTQERGRDQCPSILH